MPHFVRTEGAVGTSACHIRKMGRKSVQRLDEGYGFRSFTLNVGWVSHRGYAADSLKCKARFCETGRGL